MVMVGGVGGRAGRSGIPLPWGGAHGAELGAGNRELEGGESASSQALLTKFFLVQIPGSGESRRERERQRERDRTSLYLPSSFLLLKRSYISVGQFIPIISCDALHSCSRISCP